MLNYVLESQVQPLQVLKFAQDLGLEELKAEATGCLGALLPHSFRAGMPASQVAEPAADMCSLQETPRTCLQVGAAPGPT